jgi:hypothetical protein
MVPAGLRPPPFDFGAYCKARSLINVHALSKPLIRSLIELFKQPELAAGTSPRLRRLPADVAEVAPRRSARGLDARQLARAPRTTRVTPQGQNEGRPARTAPRSCSLR